MPRLPRAPELTWRDDGTPVANAFDDVYFTPGSGMDETHTVFLNACGLPHRWQGRDRFVAAETGFGTGLNFLATWQMWRAARPSADAWLHFISFEGFPLRRQDAARALTEWSDLHLLADQLIAKWPHGAKGVRRLVFPDDGVTLTLHIGDIEHTLPASRFSADAWFLDGFSPSKNDAMWDDDLYPLIAQRCNNGARLGTFTVAGKVRRGLMAAGFTVTKQPGHGRKRDRLEAEIPDAPKPVADTYGIRGPDLPPKRIAIIGAGIAGANAARALIDHGAAVRVFDKAFAPASAASGNPLALLMPRLDAGDTVQARLLIDAYISARSAYAGLPGAAETEVRQTPRDETEAARFTKVLTDPPLPLEDLEALQGGGLLHKQALILRPHELIPALLEGTEQHYGVEPDRDAYDAIIDASGTALGAGREWLGLTARLGQVEHISGGTDQPASAIAAGTYALANGPERLWGATFETPQSEVPETSETARASNAEALKSLAPYWQRDARDLPVTSRAGHRATTADRLPIIGAEPDYAAAVEAFAAYRQGRLADIDAPIIEGQYLMGGFGSRGFTWGPWAGGIIAAQLFGAPSPAESKALEAVSPMRIILRGLKRGDIPMA